MIAFTSNFGIFWNALHPESHYQAEMSCHSRAWSRNVKSDMFIHAIIHQNCRLLDLDISKAHLDRLDKPVMRNQSEIPLPGLMGPRHHDILPARHGKMPSRYQTPMAQTQCNSNQKPFVTFNFSWECCNWPKQVHDILYMGSLVDKSGKAAAVDPAEPKPILEAAGREGVVIDTILTTHKHWYSLLSLNACFRPCSVGYLQAQGHLLCVNTAFKLTQRHQKFGFDIPHPTKELGMYLARLEIPWNSCKVVCLS